MRTRRVEGARVGELFSSEKRRDAHLASAQSEGYWPTRGAKRKSSLWHSLLHVRGRDERRRRWKRFDVYGPGRRKNREDCGGPPIDDEFVSKSKNRYGKEVDEETFEKAYGGNAGKAVEFVFNNDGHGERNWF